MWRKSISLPGGPGRACLIAGLLAVAPPANADSGATNNLPRFLGAASCASSSCHGGGGESQNQFLVWSLRDSHCSRPYATLTTARARQIAAALGIKEALRDSQCTSCHAPLETVPEQKRGPGFDSSQGVSCESCHGPAEFYLRSHTRRDLPHPAKVQAGLRELNSLYDRANTCVACHQVVETRLIRAGHPELIFELDGQCVAEPAHWREATNFSHAQAWAIGQAAALRELSWQMNTDSGAHDSLIPKQQAIVWVLGKAGDFFLEGKQTNVMRTADALAKKISAERWTADRSWQILRNLAASSADFRGTDKSTAMQVRRAERLVLGLDRLAVSVDLKHSNGAADASLTRLFELSQSLPDFDPVKFASELESLAAYLAKK